MTVSDEQMRKLVAPALVSAVRKGTAQGVRIGVEFSLGAIKKAANDYDSRGDTNTAEALRDTAAAIYESADLLLATPEPETAEYRNTGNCPAHHPDAGYRSPRPTECTCTGPVRPDAEVGTDG
ncbi:hypothetical protein A5721_10730 [Mycobacterium vulneris]|nr:hypothetical protein A5721_10730 [Mycolicibacterium vulneris]